MSRSFAALLVLAGLLSVSEARAGHLFRGRGASVAGTTTVSPSSVGVTSTGSVAGAVPAAHHYPYSYYVAYPNPARAYVGYGGQDNFPFYGQPYGRPYDPWTWQYTSGSYQASLARYYDPPVK